jgi:hypothetical protein
MEVRDVASFLVGTWRRNLEVRSFGASFEQQRPQNSFVIIEEAPEAAPEPGTRLVYLYTFDRSKADDFISLNNGVSIGF